MSGSFGSNLRKNRSLLFIGIILIFMILVGSIYVIGSLKYKVVRFRFSTSYASPSGYRLHNGFIGEEVLNSSDVVWYYKDVGGAFNFISIENDINEEEFVKDYSARLLIESYHTDLYIVLGFLNESAPAGSPLVIITEVFSSITEDFTGDAFEIVINSVNVVEGTIDYTLTPLVFLGEAFFSLV